MFPPNVHPMSLPTYLSRSMTYPGRCSTLTSAPFGLSFMVCLSPESAAHAVQEVLQLRQARYGGMD